jgi:hypothetical protein
MPSVNPGPATTVTASIDAVMAPATTPNFNSQGQGTNAYRLLAVGRQIPVNSTGDVAFLPLINTQAFALLPAASAFVFANPGTLINGVFTAASIASTVLLLYSGPNATGLPLTASTTLSTLAASGTAASLIQVVSTVAGAQGYLSAATWGVGETTGLGGASSYGIYVHINTASGVASSVVDLFAYGVDLT